MMVRSTPPLAKTQTAAGYVQRRARNPLTRTHAAAVQQAIAICRAADNPVDAATALTGLLTAVAECAGSSWLKANTEDPDVARFTELQESAARPAPAGGFPEASDLDEVLAAVLWAATGHSDHNAGVTHPAADTPGEQPERLLPRSERRVAHAAVDGLAARR